MEKPANSPKDTQRSDSNEPPKFEFADVDLLDTPARPSDGAATDATAIDVGEIAGDLESAAGEATVGAAFGGQFLQKRGFGWLLENDDEDDDEPLKPLLEELDIDIADIWHKLRCVLLPIDALGFQRSIVRESPDFWGPLLVVLSFSALSMWGNWKAVGWILTVWFFGSLNIFLLVAAMGAADSFSQTLGVIGYSLLPLAIVLTVAPLVYHIGFIAFSLKIVGVCWSAQSAGSLLVTEAVQSRKILIMYPTALLYGYFLSLHSGA